MCLMFVLVCMIGYGVWICVDVCGVVCVVELYLFHEYVCCLLWWDVVLWVCVML